jgi:hypothetical protein
VAGFDVFVSYAHADRERVLALRDALTATGLRVWLDDREIDTFTSITGAIERGLERSRVLLAFYSQAYPSRRACQWELTAALLAAQRAGLDPRERILVVNPEPGAAHVEPVELRDALHAAAPATADQAGWQLLAGRVVAHLHGVSGELGALGVGSRPAWHGRAALGSARFVGRTRDMWAVHSALSATSVGLISGHSTADPAVKVAGLGGIGKSLLAHEYALRYAAAYPGGVFWLRAHGHDPEAATLVSRHARDADRDTQLLGFAGDLGLDVDALTPGQLRGALARALDGRDEPFLWVVDDLPADLDSPALEQWLAPGSRGRTLVTTRSRQYAAVGAQIDLGVLTAGEGLELLERHRPPSTRAEHDAAERLVSDLGGHALALDVAGAALAAERGARSYAEYQAALADPAADELELAAALAGELPGGHEASIASTLMRSVAQLPEAGLDFLRLAAQLATDAIPARLVIDTLTVADTLDEPSARRVAVSGMHAAVVRSLADQTGPDERRVHTLVARTMRYRESLPARASALRGAATSALATRLRELEGERVSADRVLLAHARHLAAPLHTQPQAALLHTVAVHDFHRGDYQGARAQEERVLDTQRRLLGERHPDTLASMSNLADTLRELGDLAVARALNEQALASLRMVLGDEHPGTLTSMNNLALTLDRMGDLTGARALHEQTLTIQRRVLGDEHPATLNSMGNLAHTLRELGDLAGARALHEQTLDTQRRVLGDEHPATLNSMNNLATTLYGSGDLASARSLHEQTLTAMRRVLGDEHPATLTSTNNLADTLGELGDLAGARALHEQTLTSQRRLLGDEHPETLTSTNNLAVTLRDLGDPAGARALHEQTLASRRRVLGDEHPDTLQSLNNLALTLCDLEDPAAARALLEQALPIMRRVLGREHPTTLNSMHNLAATLYGSGDPVGARALYAKTYALLRRVLGDGHPKTQLTLRLLTEVRDELGEDTSALGQRARLRAPWRRHAR